MSDKTKVVIFVCTGNTCRSPMAEGFANSAGAEGFTFISRGIYVGPLDPSANAVIVMNGYGIDISNKKAALITGDDVKDAFAVLTMTKAHKNLLLGNFDNLGNKVFTLTEYAIDNDNDVSDPFGMDLDEYKRCADEIRGYVLEAVNKLKMN